MTAYEVAPDGSFMPVTGRLATLAAVGGLWATPGDMLRLSTGWASLLPAALARPRGYIPAHLAFATLWL